MLMGKKTNKHKELPDCVLFIKKNRQAGAQLGLRSIRHLTLHYKRGKKTLFVIKPAHSALKKEPGLNSYTKTNKSTIELRRKGSEAALGAQKQGHSLPHPCTLMSVALLQTSARRRVGAKSEGSVAKKIKVKIKVISLGSLHCIHPSNLAQTAHGTESPTGFPLP